MLLRGLVDEDFLQYRKASMFLIFPFCSFKCDKEAGVAVCQNSALAKEKIIECEAADLVDRYLQNDLTSAVVCGGLEPMESFEELEEFVRLLRLKSEDPVIIYTGFNPEEIPDKIKRLRGFGNIIVKFGRFIPNAPSRFDKILGVTLASDNQYARAL